MRVGLQDAARIVIMQVLDRTAPRLAYSVENSHPIKFEHVYVYGGHLHNISLAQ